MCTLPEVEAGVLAEVDAWGRDKPFSSIEDLGQVSRVFPKALGTRIRMDEDCRLVILHTADQAELNARGCEHNRSWRPTRLQFYL